MHNPLCELNYLVSERSFLHRDHDTSLLCEVQLFTSTWSPTQLLENPNKPNSIIRVASPNSCAYVAASIPCPRDQVIRSSFNELHRAQAIVTKSSAANQTDWVIWTSLPIPSWRTTVLSLSRLPTWDSCFFIYFCGFILVLIAANNSTFSSMS